MFFSPSTPSNSDFEFSAGEHGEAPTGKGETGTIEPPAGNASSLCSGKEPDGTSFRNLTVISDLGADWQIVRVDGLSIDLPPSDGSEASGIAKNDSFDKPQSSQSTGKLTSEVVFPIEGDLDSTDRVLADGFKPDMEDREDKGREAQIPLSIDLTFMPDDIIENHLKVENGSLINVHQEIAPVIRVAFGSEVKLVRIDLKGAIGKLSSSHLITEYNWKCHFNEYELHGFRATDWSHKVFKVVKVWAISLHRYGKEASGICQGTVRLFRAAALEGKSGGAPQLSIESPPTGTLELCQITTESPA